MTNRHYIKKVAIIARGLTQGGVSRFLFNLLLELQKNKKYYFYLIYDESLYQFPQFLEIKNMKKIFIKSGNGDLSKIFWDFYLAPLKIRKLAIDIVIYPKNIIFPTHFFLKAKKYNIVHDLGYFEKKIGAYKFWDTVFMKFFMGFSCHVSSKVFAVSEATKQDIIKKLKIKNDQIVVIHEGVENKFKVIDDESTKERIMFKYGILRPYIFYCGSISPRKNVVRMLKSFNRIKEKIPHYFYITGSKKWNSKKVFDYLRLNKCLDERVKRIGFIDEKDLPFIYNSADLFMFPSLYEGFGLPILEAQSCACPVITSNVTSCPEVAGDGAYIIDPYQTYEISEGVLKIIEDEGYRVDLIRKGFENLKRFSWNKTANIILKNIDLCE